MSREMCPREPEVLTVLRAGQWPESCGEEIRSHVLECANCSELAAVAAAMLADNELAMKDVAVAPSGVVWWRAQRRARQRATTTAMRAVTAVQATVVIVAFAVMAVIIGAMGLTIDWPALIVQGSQAMKLALPFALVMLACLTLAPLAVYLVLRRE